MTNENKVVQAGAVDLAKTDAKADALHKAKPVNGLEEIARLQNPKAPELVDENIGRNVNLLIRGVTSSFNQEGVYKGVKKIGSYEAIVLDQKNSKEKYTREYFYAIKDIICIDFLK